MLNKPFVVLAFCLLPLSSLASDLRTRVDQTILPLMKKYDIPGMSVAVTVDGDAKIFNFGQASRETGAPVTDATLFELGSISKVFSALLVAHAVEKGKLSLSDHPGKYMPELKGTPVDNATMLHLGTYTAGGLPLQFPIEVETDAQVPQYFQRWQARFAPGDRREYSNPSLGLFGHLAALSLGRTFENAMELGVLGPLGLRQTHVSVPSAAMGQYAWGYSKANKPIRVSPGPLAAPAYGVRSSGADMIRFVQMNIASDSLDTSSQRMLAATQVGYFQVGVMTQGLGWEAYPWPVSLDTLLSGNSEKMIFDAQPAVPRNPTAVKGYVNKTGSTAGFGNYVAFLPSKKLGIVLLANKNYPIPERVRAAHAILSALEK